MRPGSLALLLLLTLLGIAPAHAASDGDVLKKFGMLGRTAVDCAAPPSSSNPNVIFAVSPQGKATRTLKMMDPGLDATLAIRNLRLLAPDTLQFNETGRQSELTITLVKIAGKFRSWRSVRADGTVLIADGKFPKTGSPHARLYVLPIIRVVGSLHSVDSITQQCPLGFRMRTF